MKWFVFVIIFLTKYVSFAQWQTDTFPPTYPIIDPTNHWDSATYSELNKAAYAFTDSTGYALYFLCVDSTKKEIAIFGNSLFKQWKMNESFDEKGILFIYAYHSKALRLVYSKPVMEFLGRNFSKDLFTYTVIPKLRYNKEKDAFLNAFNFLQNKIINNKTR